MSVFMRSQGVPKKIDRTAYEPAYAQLAGILREQVAAGVYRPGEQLPSEAVLCRNYNVSPMTVRRAVNLLIDQEVVTTVQGKGTFVKALDFGSINFSLRHFQALFRDKKRTKVRFLEVRIIRADERIAAKIEVGVGRRVIFMRRLILSDGKPQIYHQENMLYDPRSPIVEGELELTSLHGLFSGKNQSSFKKGRLELQATIPDNQVARLLECAEGAPALKLEHVFYDFKDRPASWGWFIFRSDLQGLTTTLGVWE